MKPITLYSFKPISKSKEIDSLSHFIEGIDFFDLKRNTKIELRYYANEDFDGRRGWELYSVWFEDKPVMICQQAGRENEDHLDYFITDEQTYDDMFEYLSSLQKTKSSTIKLYNPNKDIKDLTTFYSNSLEKFYDPKGVSPKYKKGDIVNAKVMENHMRDCYLLNPKYITTRCEIREVFPHNPNRTYWGWQLDRRPGDRGNMIFEKNKGGCGADFSDKDIEGFCIK
jgi:hypothetical protein